MLHRIRTLVVLFLVMGLFIAAGPSSQPAQPYVPTTAGVPKLKLAKMWSLEPSLSGRFDPSGLFYWPQTKSLLTVNDKPDEVQVHTILPASPKSSAREVKMLFRAKATIQRTSPMFPGYRFMYDLEGITGCGGHLFVVSEEPRTIIRINPKTKATTSHTLDVEDYYKRSARMRHPIARFSFHPNAGFEGITCDPKTGRLYVVQERQPRYILVVSKPSEWKQGKKLRILSHFDLPTFSLPRQIRGIDSEPDFAGADFDSGSLYILYRNERLVLKVNPKTNSLVSSYSYRHVEDNLYQQRLPFGLAEGLVVKGNRIFIVLDNNRRPRVNNSSDIRPVLFSFVRPKGF